MRQSTNGEFDVLDGCPIPRQSFPQADNQVAVFAARQTAKFRWLRELKERKLGTLRAHKPPGREVCQC